MNSPNPDVARLRQEHAIQAPEAHALFKVVQDGEEPSLAEEQAKAAIQRTRLNFRLQPRVPWQALHDLVGPVLPETWWVVGAQTGHGKTTLLMNWIRALAGSKTVYVLPLEQRPAIMRLIWAAQSLGFDTALVLENRWRDLPDDAEKLVQAHVAEQVSWAEQIVFSDLEYLGAGQLREAFQDAAANQADLILVDHLHRMAESSYRAMSEVAQLMSKYVREYGIPAVCTAQFNQGHERSPLQGYREPALSDLYMSQVIAHEAHVILGMYRPLLEMVTREELTAVRERREKAWKYAKTNTVGVHVMKHRVRGMLAEGKSVELTYDRGRIL